MRTRKKRGKKPATVTLNQSEIMLACDHYLRSRGYKLGNLSWMKIQMPKDGRHSRVEVIAELSEETA